MNELHELIRRVKIWSDITVGFVDDGTYVDTSTLAEGVEALELENARLALWVAELEADLKALRNGKDAVIDDRNKTVFELTKRVAELEARDASRDKSKLHSRNVLEKAVAKREVENAELRDRVAELEDALSKERDVSSIDLQVQREMRDATSADLQSQLDESQKRVAELEDEVIRLRSFETLANIHRATIADLQSRLTWTPVSTGLPTEPGLYEVLWSGNEITGPFSSDELAAFPESMRALWTNYRRIELTEAV